MQGDEDTNVPKVLIRAKRLTKRYKKAGIDDVSFEVRRNEVFGLLGNNGCGKTTIINILTGLVKSDSGTIEFNFESDDIMRNIRLCQQNDFLFSELTVMEHF